MSDIFQNSVRAIRAQEAADHVYDLLRLGHAKQGLLLEVLEALEKENLPAFINQLSKRIANGDCK
jgi:hypothetical protein